MDEKLRLVYQNALELEEDDSDNSTEVFPEEEFKYEVDDQEFKFEVDQNYEVEGNEQVEDDVIEMVDIKNEESTTDFSGCEMEDDDSDESSEESSSDNEEFSGLCDSELDLSDEFDADDPPVHGPPTAASRNIPVGSTDSVWTWVSPPEEELSLPRKFTVKAVGPQNIPEGASPLDYFFLFMTKSVWRKMVQATNTQAKVRLHNLNQLPRGPNHGLNMNLRISKWVDVTIEEMQRFWSMLINMGLTKRRIYKDMWDTNSTQFIPFFSRTMSLRRFEAIKSMLCLSAGKTKQISNLDSIQDFMVTMNKKFKLYHIPEQEIQISECTIERKNSVVILKRKSNPRYYRNGLKMFELRDSYSSYVYHIASYPAKEFLKNRYTFTQNVVEEIVSNSSFTGKGYHVFTNIVCNKISLAEKFFTMDTFLTSPVKKPKEELPNVVTEMLLQRGRQLYLRKGPVLVVGDKTLASKKQCLVTTGCHAEDVRVEDKRKVKPLVLQRYKNPLKSLRTRCDMEELVTFNTSAKLYWKKILFYFVDMALLNAHILYNSNNLKSVSLKDFLVPIVQTLSSCSGFGDVTGHHLPMTKVVRSSKTAEEGAHPKHYLVSQRSGSRRGCVICKARGKQNRCNWMCHGCNLPVHIECFIHLQHS